MVLVSSYCSIIAELTEPWMISGKPLVSIEIRTIWSTWLIFCGITSFACLIYIPAVKQSFLTFLTRGNNIIGWKSKCSCRSFLYVLEMTSCLFFYWWRTSSWEMALPWNLQQLLQPQSESVFRECVRCTDSALSAAEAEVQFSRDEERTTTNAIFV